MVQHAFLVQRAIPVQRAFLAQHAFLAQRVSSINSIAALCETTGADVREVGRAIGSDSRIGSRFLQSGPGFGGSCFQKDILNLVYLCRHYGLEDVASYWEQVVRLNTWQQLRIAKLVVEKLFNTVAGKKIALLGFAFKADTNDTRESPAIRIAKELIEEGAQLAIHDPKVSEEQIKIDLDSKPGNGEGRWKQESNVLDACEGADAVIIATEWKEYQEIDWIKIHSLMRKPAWLFDARCVADKGAAVAAGLKVWRVGEG